MKSRGAIVAAYAKDHSYYETLDFVCKMIGLDSNIVLDKKDEPSEQMDEHPPVPEDAKNPVEYWVGLSEEEQKKFKSVDELNQYFNTSKEEKE